MIYYTDRASKNYLQFVPKQVDKGPENSSLSNLVTLTCGRRVRKVSQGTDRLCPVSSFSQSISSQKSDRFVTYLLVRGDKLET